MHYHPVTDEDKRAILSEIGASSFEELLSDIPPSLRRPPISLPAALSEVEVQALLRQLSGRNASVSGYLSFLGGGSYEHFIPAAVGEIIRRNEFYTAYTPYQAEAAQGTLQAIYEYQSLIVELTGMDVANASHYDGATSLAEAVLMCLRQTGRGKVLIAQSVHPHYRGVLRTYLQGTSFTVEEFGFTDGYGFDRKSFLDHLGPDVGAVVFQTPNFFGVLEDLEGVSDTVHQAGALLVIASHPLSLGALKTPAQWGADVAVGEGQPLGIPVSFGGPYLGFIAASRALLRRMPGRLAGMTRDREGRRVFCLTLQAREQHIRREKASSNICSNQALCALAAAVYMTLLGREGIREAAELNLDRAAYLRGRIADLPGYEVDPDAPIFNEFVVTAKKPFKEIQARLAGRHILAGIDLSEHYPSFKNRFLVCATETKTHEDLELFATELSKC